MSKNDKIGGIVCALAGMNSSYLGLVRDVVNRLNQPHPDAAAYHTLIANAIKQGISQLSTTMRVVVDYDDPSQGEMVDDCQFGWVNKGIVSFPMKGSGKVEFEVELLHLNKKMSSPLAALEIMSRNFRPAPPEVLLAFAEKYPHEQCKYRITALGSSATVTGLAGSENPVPVLGLDREDRSLTWDVWNRDWGPFYRFLVIRNKPGAIDS